MRYLSVCSGIEAVTVAWSPLGFTPVAFAEIDAFPSAVLQYHYPQVPNWGDLTQWKDWPDAALDVLVGGTPCQSFSVAGLRAGLADPRGNLALVYLAILERYRPQWCLWENVPGVLSSNDGRDFGAFLGGLASLGYGWAYRVLDAQFFGVAQRRRRVFVVACRGARTFCAAAVLFDRESLSGHPPPRRETGQRPAPTLGAGPVSGGRTYGADSAETADASLPAVSLCLNAGAMGRIDAESETLIPIGGAFDVAHSLRADGFDASEDGTGRSTPLVPVAATGFYSNLGTHRGGIEDDRSPTLKGGAHANYAAVAFDARQSDVIHYGDQSGPLDTCGHSVGIHSGMAVRRLTPLECCRLQGFPDTYLDIPYRGTPAADGPKYKALGNSMAVPVIQWLGRRLLAVHALPDPTPTDPWHS